MKKLNKQTKIVLIISSILIVLIILVCVIWRNKSVEKTKKEAEAVNIQMQTRINTASRTVYRALVDISQGQLLDSELISCVTGTLNEDTPEMLMTADDIGKQATVNISAGQTVYKNMVTDPLDQDWQEVELNCIFLSTNLKKYDYVDIRIMYPDGRDYIVASKKSIKKIKLSNNNVFFWLNENEILTLNSAIVDANLHNARIYTTRYVKPEIEDANVVNYQPTKSIIELVRSDPNAVEEAKAYLSENARARMEELMKNFKSDKHALDTENQENGYDFDLDITTGSGGNNGGYTPDAEDLAESENGGTDASGADTSGAVDSARNEETGDTVLNQQPTE